MWARNEANTETTGLVDFAGRRPPGKGVAMKPPNSRRPRLVRAENSILRLMGFSKKNDHEKGSFDDRDSRRVIAPLSVALACQHKECAKLPGSDKEHCWCEDFIDNKFVITIDRSDTRLVDHARKHLRAR